MLTLGVLQFIALLNVYQLVLVGKLLSFIGVEYPQLDQELLLPVRVFESAQIEFGF